MSPNKGLNRGDSISKRLTESSISTYNVDNEEPIAGAPDEEEPSGLQLENPVLQLSAATRTLNENKLRYLLKSMVPVVFQRTIPG